MIGGAQPDTPNPRSSGPASGPTGSVPEARTFDAGAVRLAIVSPTRTGAAAEAADRLRRRYGERGPAEADILVAVGGNSAVLRALRLEHRLPVFGLSLGAADFLTNAYSEADLPSRVAGAGRVSVRPLRMACTLENGACREALAYNDIAILRASGRMARLTISVDGRPRVEDALGDGVLVATPMGSTAYNRAAGGPVLPLDSRALVLTPLAPSRPTWSSVVLSNRSEVTIEVLEPQLRPVILTADHEELRGVVSATIRLEPGPGRALLFSDGDGLHERQLDEQF